MAPAPAFEGRVWYLATAMPSREIYATCSLVERGFTAWLPLCTVTVRHARRVEAKRAALFPGYLFVALSPGQAFRWILATPGVSSVVKAGNTPLVVRPATLDKVAAALAAHERGLRAPQAAPPPFHPGQKLRVTEGPLTGLEGICTLAAHERTAVLLRFLGGEQRAVLPTHILRVAD